MVTAQLTPVGVGIHNVLIATDFSTYSSAALDFGLQLSKRYGATAYVVFVVPADEFLIAGPEACVAAKDAAFRDLQALKADLERTHSYVEGKEYYLHLLEGEVAPTILDFAHQKQVDLIVVGTHGRGGLGKALMGSVAERVFRNSRVPVLTLGPHLSRSYARNPKNILVATDFMPASERAVEYAAWVAQEQDAKLTVVHVLKSAPTDEVECSRLLQTAKTRLAELVVRQAKGVQCCSWVKTGPVVPTLLRALDDTQSDLLVIGVRPSSGLLDRLMFPHAYELVCESSCPVLTLRETPRPANVN